MFSGVVKIGFASLALGVGVNAYIQSGAKTPPDFPTDYNNNTHSQDKSNPGTQSLPEHSCPIAIFNEARVNIKYQYTYSYYDPFDSTFSVPRPKWNPVETVAPKDGKCLKPSPSVDDGRYFIDVNLSEAVRGSGCYIELQYKLEAGRRYAFFVKPRDHCIDLGLVKEKG